MICVIFLLKVGQMLWSYRKCQKTEVWKKTGLSYDEKVAKLYSQTFPDNLLGTM